MNGLMLTSNKYFELIMVRVGKSRARKYFERRAWHTPSTNSRVKLHGIRVAQARLPIRVIHSDRACRFLQIIKTSDASSSQRWLGVLSSAECSLEIEIKMSSGYFTPALKEWQEYLYRVPTIAGNNSDDLFYLPPPVSEVGDIDGDTSGTRIFKNVGRMRH